MLFCYQTLGKLMRLLQGKKKKCIRNPGIPFLHTDILATGLFSVIAGYQNFLYEIFEVGCDFLSIF